MSETTEPGRRLLRSKLSVLVLGALVLGLCLRWVILQQPRSPRMPKVSIRLVGFQSGEKYNFAKFSISNESNVRVEWNVDSRYEYCGTSVVCVAIGTGGGVLAPGETFVWNCDTPEEPVTWKGLIRIGERRTFLDSAKRSANQILPRALHLPERELPTWTIETPTVQASHMTAP